MLIHGSTISKNRQNNFCMKHKKVLIYFEFIVLIFNNNNFFIKHKKVLITVEYDFFQLTSG